MLLSPPFGLQSSPSLKGSGHLFTRCADHYRSRPALPSWEDENAVFTLPQTPLPQPPAPPGNHAVVCQCRALLQQWLRRPSDSAPPDYSRGLGKRVIVAAHYMRSPASPVRHCCRRDREPARVGGWVGGRVRGVEDRAKKNVVTSANTVGPSKVFWLCPVPLT